MIANRQNLLASAAIPEATLTSIANPDALMTRSATAVALTAAGFPVKSATLATKATRGGGPPYRLFGTRPLYRWADAVAWAQSRLSAPIQNSSEADARDGPRLLAKPKGADQHEVRTEK
jgi:hypothetical protein